VEAEEAASWKEESTTGVAGARRRSAQTRRIPPVRGDALFHQRSKVATVELHMDDFHTTGPRAQLEWLGEALKRNFRTNQVEIYGVGSTYTHLKRRRERTEEGMKITPSKAHVSKLKKLYGLDHCATKGTPIVKESAKADEAEESSRSLTTAEKARYRTAVGVLLYYAQDRPDIQFAAGVLGRKLSEPTEKEESQMRRLIRYLAGTEEVGLLLPARGTDAGARELQIFSDADWAGESGQRKSVSCGAIMLQGGLLYSYSRRQGVVAQSSGEAEYYAAATAASEGVLVVKVLSFVGVPLDPVLFFGLFSSHWNLQAGGRRKVQALRDEGAVAAAVGQGPSVEGSKVCSRGK